MKCKLCQEEIKWVLGMRPDGGGGEWLDDAWDEAVCLSGSVLIRLISSGRLGKVTGWDQHMEELMWDMFIPRHVPELLFQGASKEVGE